MGERQTLIERVEGAAREIRDPDQFLRAVVRAIHESSSGYDWTGVYLREGEELILNTYLGPPSPHQRIPIAKGICGAAAREGRTIVVPDVSRDDRYLACSRETRSEIVVPIFREGDVIGEIDIDSNTPDRFGTADRETIESIAALVASRLGDRPGRREEE